MKGKNKLFILVAVATLVIVYLIYRNTKPAAATTPAPAENGEDGNGVPNLPNGG